MAKIVSTYKAPLGLPSGVFLRPGVPVEIKDWRVLRNHGVVKQWLAAGVIEVVEDAEDELADPLDHDGDGNKGGSLPASEPDELADLKAQAKELGIVVHWRWDREKIEAAINEKLAS
jgi:hypothetical protein